MAYKAGKDEKLGKKFNLKIATHHENFEVSINSLDCLFFLTLGNLYMCLLQFYNVFSIEFHSHSPIANCVST